MTKALPPYGKHYLANPRNGAHVAIGPAAWDFANNRRYPVMVIPAGEQPTDRRWPTIRGPALIWDSDDDIDLLIATATCLLQAGATSVVALRDVEMHTDPRMFFDAEVTYV
jgi:hypothetical protein